MTENFEKAIEETLTRMYNEAEPGLDFSKVVADPESVEEEFYKNHYLSADRQKEIIQDVADKYDITSGKERMTLAARTVFGVAPSTVED